MENIPKGYVPRKLAKPLYVFSNIIISWIVVLILWILIREWGVAMFKEYDTYFKIFWLVTWVPWIILFYKSYRKIRPYS